MRVNALITAALLCCGVFGQEIKPPNPNPTPFQVEYTIRDANDPAAKNGRHYVLQIDNMNSRGTIRSGAKVPYPTGTANGAVTQWNYADVGVNIDCRLYEKDGRLMMNSSFDLSSLSSNSSGGGPTVNQVRNETGTVVTLGKEMTLLTIDDPLIQRKLRVDAIVSQLK
jgi:hypothetical protein